MIVIRDATPAEVRVLTQLQRQMNDAQADFQAAFSAFAPNEGCELQGGKWIQTVLEGPEDAEGAPTPED